MLSGKIDLTKIPLGKMLALYANGLLILFLRTKTLLEGGSHVRTRVLQELNRKCKCKHGLGKQALIGFSGQEAT